FLAGRSGALERDLEARMRAAAAEEDFEHAAMLRDALTALRQASERNAIVLGDGANADIIALAEDPLEVAVQIFHVRSGRVAGERGWVADRTDDTQTPGLVETFLLQLYSGQADAADGASGVPPEILVPALPPSATALTQWLSGLRHAKVDLRVPQRGDKRVLLDTVARNAAQTLAQHKLKRSTDLTRRNEALAQLQDALGLAEAPLRIECYDISHTQGTNVVGSMIVFEDGLPRKAEYRRFIIKSFQGSDDEAAMDEVLTRRLKRLLDDDAALRAKGDEAVAALVDPETGKAKRFAYRPALVVVDGGLPQVNAVQAVFDRLEVRDVALVGLAKRLEEVWVPGQEYPIILPRTSEGLYLLQRVRDEAHRFAITFHRERRGKAMVESILDGVPGLGEVRRTTVFKAYPSVAKLRQAGLDDLASLPGIGMRTAEAIISALETERQARALGELGVAVNTATGEIVG
ncbi:MAG: excinuclease ABC subunit UvrC, partial [Propionibacteriaceae bacterium]|nr:excinuclease ABC subunit UvrC [Propionibacteriaceae bacterium]